jgi:DNA modification methylase
MPEKVVIGTAELWHGDCREVLPLLPKHDLLLTDPPYGTAAMWQSKNGTPKNKPTDKKWALFGAGDIRDWDVLETEVVLGLPALARKAVIWGGQMYPMPTVRSWLVWNKIIRNFSTGVCELAWTNLDQPIDAFDYSHGQLATEGKQHPTQKPLPLMLWCIKKAGAVSSVLDPFMGSGTTGVACAQLGKAFTGIERERKYFDIACERISRAQAQGQLLPPEPAAVAVQQTLELP